MNKLNLVRLNLSYSEQIQNIWVKSLPNNLKSIIGKDLIHKYISLFFENKNNLGIGLVKDNELIGFVMYGNDKDIQKKLIKKRFFDILNSFFISMIKLEIKKIINYFDCVLFIFLSGVKEKKLNLSHVELLIICVCPLYQGQKYGSYLIEKSIKYYLSYFKKYDGLFLKTLKKDQQNILFYKKNNFKIIGEIFGRIYLKYIN